MRKSPNQNFTRWLYKGLIGLLSILMLIVLSISQVSGASASAASSQAGTSTSDIRSTFVLGGYGSEIAMFNNQEGWGTSLQGTVHTSDGGQTWQTLAKFNEPFGGPDFIVDGQTLWENTLNADYTQTLSFVRTNDGGQSWTSFANPKPTMHPTNFSGIDRQRAWVSMYDYSTNKQALYLVGGSKQPVKKATLPNQDQVNSIYFLSDRTGWVIANQELYRTDDGAKTWVKQNLPLPAGIDSTFSTRAFSLLGFAQPQNSTGFLQTTYVNPENSAASTYIYRTLDGGLTWQIYGGAQPAGTDHIAQIDTWNLPNPALAGLRPDRGYQVVLATLQNGQWSTESLATPSQLPDNCPYCFFSRLSPQVIFMSEDSSDYPSHALDLYKSTNGGATWKKVGSTPGAAA
jgi:hypothetical protein